MERPEQRGRRALVRVVQAGLALLLIAAVVSVATPEAFAGLIRRTRPEGVALAAACYVVVSILRGLRLATLAPLAPVRAILVATSVQAAVQVIPARLGELALPVLLKREAGVGLPSGAGILLASRAFDLAGLGTWAGAAIALGWGLERPVVLAAAVLLVLPLVALPFVTGALDRLVTRCLAPRGTRWRRRARQARRLGSTIDELRSQPLRLVAAMALSLLIWGGIWLSIWVLLRAMAHPWPMTDVVLGATAATVATFVPINILGNFGTLETGWTAGFVALGIPLETAAASGLAVHSWSLLITVIVGSTAYMALQRWRA